MEMWQVKVEVRSMPTTAHEYVLTPGPKFAVLKYYFHREPVARCCNFFYVWEHFTDPCIFVGELSSRSDQGNGPWVPHVQFCAGGPNI